MPKFLEEKLKREYGEKSAVPYKVMNSIGAMKGNQETAKGRAMERKHEADMKGHNLRSMRIEVHRGKNKEITGHTVHHEMMPKPSKGTGAFYEDTHEEYPFDAKGQSSSHGSMVDHVTKHLNLSAPSQNEQETEEQNQVDD